MDADLADMQLITKHNKEIRFLLCVIDIFSNYALLILLKDKKDVTMVNPLQKTLNCSKEKQNCSNRIWVDKGSKFYNRSINSWLEKNNIEMHSTYNEEKSVAAEKFTGTLRKKIYKHMTSILIILTY